LASCRCNSIGRKPTAARFRLPNGGKPKAEALADAGLSTSTAQRYEELAGGREKQGQKVAAVAADKYFAEQRQAKEPPTIPAQLGPMSGARTTGAAR